LYRSDEPLPRVVAAACDGACRGNPGPGGWGALLRFEDGSVQEFGGADPDTTNNRMELIAALTLLEHLREMPLHPSLTIRTDSRYLIDGFSKWLAGWKRKGWRTASGGAVLNRDLWEALDRARLPGVPLTHVKGHSGDPDNERCDAIAVAFSRGSRPRLATPATTPMPTAVTSTAAKHTASKSTASKPTAVASTAVEATASKSTAAEATAVAPGPAEDAAEHQPAPAALQALLTRLELADRLAKGGYALRLAELAQLVEMPLRQLESRQEPWGWRDWQVIPLGDGRWRLDRGAAGSEHPGGG
jgi:ribonuclease HI